MREFMWTWAYLTVVVIGCGLGVMSVVVLAVAAFVSHPAWFLLTPLGMLVFTASGWAAMRCLDKAMP